jgi:hypothetical protein
MNQDELAQRDRMRADRKMQRAQRQLLFLFFGALITIGMILYSYWSDKDAAPAAPEPEVVDTPVVKDPRSLPPAAPAATDAAPTPRPQADTAGDGAASEGIAEKVAAPADGGPTLAPMAESLAETARGAPTSVEAVALWERYLTAKTLGQFRVLMYEKPDLDERFMEYYDTRKGRNPAGGDKMIEAEVMISDERWRVISFKSTSRRSGVVHAGFRRDHLGRVRLDWESLVGHSEMDWSEFRDRRVSEPKLFRAYMIKDDYYNFEFADEKKFMSVRFFSPDGAWALSGFCEHDSPEGIAVGSLLAAEGESSSAVAGNSAKNFMPVTVRLAFPEQSASDHCVWVREVVCGQWFMK